MVRLIYDTPHSKSMNSMLRASPTRAPFFHGGSFSSNPSSKSMNIRPMVLSIMSIQGSFWHSNVQFFSFSRISLVSNGSLGKDGKEQFMLSDLSCICVERGDFPCTIVLENYVSSSAHLDFWVQVIRNEAYKKNLEDVG